MRLGKVFSVMLGVAAAASALSQLNFAQRNVAIRAGVVLLDSQQIAGGQRANYAPYVWQMLDANRNVKPAGWSFYNPNANTRYTDAIRDRWIAHNAALGHGGGPATGEQITKRDGAYWEFILSQASDAQITSYDVLFLAAYGTVSLNPLERENLRKFLEAGGVLWVDVRNGLNLDVINGFPLPFFIGSGGGGPADGDFKHPLLSVPHTIGFDSLSLMQSENILGLRPVDLSGLGFNDIRPIQGPVEAEFARFLAVASDPNGTAVMVGQVGDGFMVVTSRGVGATLNRTQSSGIVANNAHRTYAPLFDRTSDAAAKFASNLANLTSGHGQMGKGSRKGNSSPIDVDAPLLRRFSDPGLALAPGNLNYVPPVIFNGLAIVSAGDHIRVYDANPASDVDGDGFPDDGIRDYSRGANMDLIWTSRAMPGPISPPIAVEVPNATAAPAQQIAVTDVAGNLYIFNAFPPAAGTGLTQSALIAPPSGTSSADTGQLGRGPYAPTYHDGQYFVSDEASAGLGGIVGRVWIADARSGAPLITASNWQAGGSSSPTLQRPSAGPVVGYIPIADNSGGVDRVVYLATRANILGGATAGISSIWVGARGEKPTSFSEVPGNLIVNTRASGQGLSVYRGGPNDPLGIKLSIIDGVGNPLGAAAMNGIFDGSVLETNGIITFGMKPGMSLPLNASIRIDYTIDWGTGDPGKTSQLVRGQIYLPDDTNRSRRILHNLALSPQGTIHLVHSPQGTSSDPASRFGGAFYSLKEEGRGAFKMLNRYELYPQHTFALNQTGSATVPVVLSDRDELQQFPGAAAFLQGDFTALTFFGGPSILNGTVYVTAKGFKNIFVPCTILMAFQAEPDIAKFEVGEVGGSFTILQPDMARSANKSQPNQFVTLQPNQFVYEREPGQDRGTVRLDNLMSSTRGPVQNAISRSQPIVIRRSGQPDLQLEPNRSGGRWTPMLWYSVFYGMENASPPMVTGNTVFLAGRSSLPEILTTGNPFPTSGILSAVDAEISPTDPFLIADASRPWLKQLWNVKIVTAPTDIRPNPAMRWPQFTGATSFEAWAVRLLQTTLPGSADAFGVVGGEGALLSWGPAGLYGFTRSDLIVADEGRLVRFDPAGNPLWSSDSTLVTGTSGDVGSAAEVKPMVRPTRAYPVSGKELVVVDTGSDRIARVDATGREIRSIDRFRLDPNFQPDGFEPNDPLTFKAPRDVITYTSYQANPAQFSNPGALEFWVHHVIADSGNKRIVEIVDRYLVDPATRRTQGILTDGSGQKAVGVLLWHSPSAFSKKNFNYTSLARVYIDAGANSRWVYAAGIGSAMPTRADTGLDSPVVLTPRESQAGNGGIVIFDGSNSQVIHQVSVPAIGANVMFNPATGNFDMPASPARAKYLGNLNSVTMRNVEVGGASLVAIMFTDSEGVFEIVQPAAGGAWTVRWMLTRDVYKVMRKAFNSNAIANNNPADFRANFARRLDSGEVLIVNGYLGRFRNAPGLFNGEIIQVDGDQDSAGTGRFGFNFNKQNLGFWTFSIRFELPPVQGARGIVIPVFADRR